MNERQPRRGNGLIANALGMLAAWALVSCGGGGGSGNAQDSGPDKTYLSVQASDADGDPLQYQWRATAGTIENRNSPQTVWTMPAGPGLHFAYVTISDGKGGYVEQQYAVSSDALGTSTPSRAPLSWAPPSTNTTSSSAGRLRFSSADALLFAVPGGGAAVSRQVYLPDVQVQIESAGGAVVASGVTDLAGELSLPPLDPGTYAVKCATVQGAPLAPCDAVTPTVTVVSGGIVAVLTPHPTLTPARNLRLFGHVALADGGACGSQSEFFAVQSAATVQLLQSDGTALAPATRVNRFGDYAIDAAVLAKGQYQLLVSCEGYSKTLAVPASPDPLGYVSTAPIELSHQIANSRPAVVKMVANGPDGNVRGAMVVPESGVSNGLPGWSQFLTYKGHDTRVSACLYYQSLGAATGCDAQGNLQNPITLDDWRRQHKLAPYDAGNAQVAATYINRMDLNLVRRMTRPRRRPTTSRSTSATIPAPTA